jgi:hypothetical protein
VQIAAIVPEVETDVTRSQLALSVHPGVEVSFFLVAKPVEMGSSHLYRRISTAYLSSIYFTVAFIEPRCCVFHTQGLPTERVGWTLSYLPGYDSHRLIRR